MSGIITIINCIKNLKNLKSIKYGFQNSIQILKSRGPDSHNILEHKKHLISITQSSTAINHIKPFIIEENIVILCDGCIYNQESLATEFNLKLKHNDINLLLILYKKLGFENMVEKLDGDFVIILIDNEKIYTARDRSGIKPLYIGKTRPAEFLAFASEAKCLDTFCKDIQQIKPGYTCFVEDVNYIPFITTISYPVLPIEIEFMDKIYTEINKLLVNSVKKRIQKGEQKIACLLSGGLSSAIITSILCKIIGSENVNTYSISFQNKNIHAKKVSEYLNTNHTDIIFDKMDFLVNIKQVIYTIESYDVNSVRESVLLYLIINYMAKNNEKIIFTGQGANDIFCGYNYFNNAPNEIEFENEYDRILETHYNFQVKNIERISVSNGIEIFLPYLDKNLINFCKNLPPSAKMPLMNFEKYILRKAFENNYIPKEILWGKSHTNNNLNILWDYIQNFAEEEIEFNQITYNSPEEQYYKDIFKDLFKTYKPKNTRHNPNWSL